MGNNIENRTNFSFIAYIYIYIYIYICALLIVLFLYIIYVKNIKFFTSYSAWFCFPSPFFPVSLFHVVKSLFFHSSYYFLHPRISRSFFSSSFSSRCRYIYIYIYIYIYPNPVKYLKKLARYIMRMEVDRLPEVLLNCKLM